MRMGFPQWGRLALVPLIAVLSLRSAAQSVYTERPNDPHAVYLTASEFGAHADGVADDADALQRAIDRVQETTHHGVVFVPAGRYRLTRTVNVWAGIRLIGFGVKRPVFVLRQETPGFQEGPDRYMLWFTDERTAPGEPVADASEFTFYSGLLNIDFELDEGNPAAVAVRFNVAQHGIISHANFQLGGARAAIEAVGNQASDIHVYGGEFGIVTGKTSPAWQFLLMDSSFSGQRTAAIRTHEAGFTLIRDRFERVPVAIQIPEGEVEQLYGRDLVMNDIRDAALEVGNVRNLRSEITLENVGCSHVSRFIAGGDALAEWNGPASPPAFYVEERFAAGLEIGRDGRESGIRLTHREQRVGQAPRETPSDIPALPAMSSWANVHELGVKGDGGTDDTAAIQRAVDAHRTLFFPSGLYRLSGSIRLRADTVLAGFSPVTTQLTLADSDGNFQGGGPAMALLVAPPGGRTIVTGIGIATGNANPRAAGVEWRAGAASMLEDVEFVRGHNAYVRALAPAMKPPPPRSGRAPMQLDAQYPSLWIHDGAGGIFRGIWSHAGTARAGLLIENTDTPGVVYQFSCEHHMSKEVRVEHAAHWKIFDLQTEEENPEGAEAVAVEVESSHDLMFANTYMYRVSRNVLPKPYAIVMNDSTDIVLANVKVFSQTRLAFDNSVFDRSSGVAVRAHHFAGFAAGGDLKRGAPLPLPAAFETGAALTRVASGFSNAAGLVSESKGTIYFTDAARHTVYRYAEGGHTAEVLAKMEQSPMVLGLASPSMLLAINNEKSIQAIDTQSGAVSPVNERDAAEPATTLLLPVGLHNELIQLQWLMARVGYEYRRGSNTARRSALLPQHRGYFYAPQTHVAVLAGGTWRPLLQSSQLAPFAAGDRHYLISEDDARTYVGEMGAGETLATKTFAERGGTAVVSDEAGNVYIADSQLHVYDREGHETGVVEVPERPSSLCFGGVDGRTLYVGARGSVYSIRVKAAGSR